MKKMTPREALYYVCVELGPQPQPKTNRDDNLTDKEARLRDAVRVLQNFVTYHNDAGKVLPESVDEFVHVDPKECPKDGFVHVKPARKSVRGSGKDRIETWKEEVRAKLYPHRT
jgi:hypothetical protein